MSPLWVACALSAFAAPIFVKVAWDVPFSFFSIAMPIRSMVVGFAIAGCVAFVCHTAFSLNPTTSGSLALGSGLLSSLWLAQRNREKRGLVLSMLRLADPSTRYEAQRAVLRKLDSLVTRADRTEGETERREHIRLVLLAAAPLVEMDMTIEVERLLSRLLSSGLSKIPRTLLLPYAQILSTLRLKLNDIEGAGEILETPALPAYDAASSDRTENVDENAMFWLSATKALWHVVQGGSEQARALLDELDGADDPLRLASLAVVGAHIDACHGREEMARAQLSEALNLVGVAALREACAPVGPATPLARDMIASVAEGDQRAVPNENLELEEK